MGLLGQCRDIRRSNGLEQFGGPVEAFAPEPGGRKTCLAVRGQHIRDGSLIGFGGGGREGERDFAQAQFKQAIAAPRLAVEGRCREGDRQPEHDLDETSKAARGVAEAAPPSSVPDTKAQKNFTVRRAGS